MRLTNQTRTVTERIAATVEDGPVWDAPYRKGARDRVAGISATRVNDAPWKIHVHLRRIKKDGTDAKTGHSSQTAGRWYSRDEAVDEFARQVAVLFGIEWEPEPEPDLARTPRSATEGNPQ